MAILKVRKVGLSLGTVPNKLRMNTAIQMNKTWSRIAWWRSSEKGLEIGFYRVRL